MAVIEVESLRKEYRRLGGTTVAVSGLDLSVPEGGVFGFLGPNGSGKTTTIRCLLGQVRATSGQARLLGAPAPNGLADVMRRVGSMVETPQFFPNFSGRRNLELLAGIDRIPRPKVGEVLDRVGLTAAAGRSFRTYSLGMKQRLGLAAALLKDPELLILDEPANGLDPAGIRATRDLIRGLGAEGRTVFVSSHLLGEVQHMCDRVAIIARGRLVASGPVEEVLQIGHAAHLVVRVAETGRAVEVLRTAGFEAQPLGPDGDGLRVAASGTEGARVTEALARAGLYLSELRAEEVDLETVFLELTDAASPEPATPAAHAEGTGP
jgi:ABC-2 type transport system ATP-binding protein